jgi:hypothetical protein
MTMRYWIYNIIVIMESSCICPSKCYAHKVKWLRETAIMLISYSCFHWVFGSLSFLISIFYSGWNHTFEYKNFDLKQFTVWLFVMSFINQLFLWKFLLQTSLKLFDLLSILHQNYTL